MDVLSVVRSRRDTAGVLSVADSPARVPRLAGPVWQGEFAVDGVLLRDLVGSAVWWESALGSVVDAAFPVASAEGVDRLLGDRGPDPDDEWLGAGRVPLAGCRVCGDLGCGGVTVRVERPGTGGAVVRWVDLRFVDMTPAGELPDLSRPGTVRTTARRAEVAADLPLPADAAARAA